MIAENDEKVKGKEENKGVDEEVHSRIGCLRRKEKRPSYNPRIDKAASLYLYRHRLT